MTFESIEARPTAIRYELLLTADTALSHHDPAVQDDSNRVLFNRQKQLRATDGAPRLPNQTLVDALTAAHPVPVEMVDLFADVAFSEFIGAALARLFLDLYNSQEGSGLFSGLERYERLETRLRTAAVCAPTLRNCWNRLCQTLQVPIHPGDRDGLLLSLLSVPMGLQQLVLRSLAEEYRSVVALARLWHSTAKLQSEAYAAKAGQAVSGPPVTLAYQAEAIAPGPAGAQVLEVPTVSGNSLRHQVVREPAWLHLCQHLGLKEAAPGQGPVPPGVEAIFYNGGNIAAGAKQPSNVFGLAQQARALYPSLDLLGGVTDSFDLGESRLRVAGWLVCAENRAALAGSPAADLPAARVSAYDLLDDVTLTRQAGEVGRGQMIFSFETLCPGTQVLCRLTLSPFTPVLTQGALVAAVETYLANDGTVGGQSARGFGHCHGERLVIPSDALAAMLAYEDYLDEHRESLRSGLIDGSLGTRTTVLS